MKRIRTLIFGTFSELWTSLTTIIVVAGFIALSNGFFLYALFSGEGSSSTIESLWSLSATAPLAVLCALITMRVWADDKKSGMIDLYLLSPISERALVFGKFMGAFLMVLIAIYLYLLLPLFILPYYSPEVSMVASFWTFIPAILSLIIQAALWCAIGTFISACTKQASTAAFITLLLIIALPYAAYRVVLAWLPALRSTISEFPLAQNVTDISTGYFSSGAIVFYIVFTFFSLFAATKAIAVLRLAGRGGRGTRFTALTAVLLGLVFSGLVSFTAIRFNVSIDLPTHSRDFAFSETTKTILEETSGEINVTCFMSRREIHYRTVSRLLRGIAATAKSSAGARVDLEFVDPRWDLGRAASLVRSGAEENSIVFSKGRRRMVVPVNNLFTTPVATNTTIQVASMQKIFIGENVCATALRRLSRPRRNDVIYWTKGHGEASFSNYDHVYGMSEISRILRQEGYTLKELDLSSELAVPEDCAILFVLCARDEFSLTELSRINGFLRNGGRLLVMTSNKIDSGVNKLLKSWGVQVLPYMTVSQRTITGTDIVVSDFAEHAITHYLKDATLLLEEAAVLVPFGGKEKEFESDVMKYTALARSDNKSWGESEPFQKPWTFDPATEKKGPLDLIVALERGGDVSEKVAFRPTRIVVIGDSTFVMNGALSTRARANKNFFMNAVSWLSGLDASFAADSSKDVFTLNMDRKRWIQYGVWSVFVMPVVVLILGWLLYLRRRYAE